jgi:hypothetical protein
MACRIPFLPHASRASLWFPPGLGERRGQARIDLFDIAKYAPSIQVSA